MSDVVPSSILPQGQRGRVFHADNLEWLQQLPDACVDLIYIDPPFNTGKTQRRTQIKSVQDAQGSHVGFQGKRYRSEEIVSRAYADHFDDYLAFLLPRVQHAQRVLKRSGSLYFHIDYREAHYCKVMLDSVFGRDNFLNEIIWAYDYGGRPKNRWPAKHDTILLYVKQAGAHVFNLVGIDRIPYMAPGLVGAEKAKRGKLPTDTWWHTIVSPTGKEKLGYPTQKPQGLIRRMIEASAPAQGLVVDFFAGSGTAGAAALSAGRRFLLVDSHPEAIDVMRRRFAGDADVDFHDNEGLV